jgi:hypothetical protein
MWAAFHCINLLQLLLLIFQASVSNQHIRKQNWLIGFQNCSNTIIAINGTVFDSDLPSINGLWITLTLITNEAYIDSLKVESKKYLFCNTFSVLYKTTGQAIDLLRNLTLDNTVISPTRPAPIRIKALTLPRYLFLIPWNASSRPEIDNLLLDKHVFESNCFMIDRDRTALKVSYICTYCMPDQPVMRKVSCSSQSFGCYDDMLSVSNSMSGQGLNLTWNIPKNIFKFPVILERLKNLVRAPLHKVLFDLKPHLDEIILATLIHDLKVTTISHTNPVSLPWIVVGAGSYKGYHLSPTGKEGFNFITCDGSSRSISFSAYAKPFTIEVWIGLVLTLIISTIIMVAITKCFRIPGLSLVSVFFTKYALLMETDVFMGQMSRSKKFRLFLAIWLFGSLIISTAYKGDNIASIIVPNEVEKKYKEFSQLEGFTLYTPSLFGQIDNKPGNNMFGFSFGNWIRETFGPKRYNQVTNESFSYSDIDEKWNLGLNRSKDKTIIKMYRRIKTIPFGEKNGTEEVLARLRNCNRSVFVSDEIQVSTLLRKLRAQGGVGDMFYTGEEPYLFQKTTSWMFSLNGGNFMPIKMARLLAGGIHAFWERILGDNLNNAISHRIGIGTTSSYENNDELMRPLSINSNLVTVFIIFVCGSIITLIVFVFELFFGRKNTVQDFDYYCVQL